MNILAVCSALNNSYIAIKYDGKTISKIIKSDENYHSLYIISKIKEIFKENNFEFEKLDAITVNCGPGSFTGIRVALSITKIMAGELNKPLIPLNTASILLEAFNKDILLMDARRDMYFVGDKEKIELVYKDKIDNYILDKTIVADKKCAETFNNAISYEDNEKDLGLVMLKLAEKEFYDTDLEKRKISFNYMNVKANYIQTPPVF